MRQDGTDLAPLRRQRGHHTAVEARRRFMARHRVPYVMTHVDSWRPGDQ